MATVSAEPRFMTPTDPAARSRIEETRKVSRVLNLSHLPWQDDALRLLSELDDDGFPVFRTAVVIVPRQAGKSKILLIIISRVGLLVPHSRTLMTAQTGHDARYQWEQHAVDLENGPVGPRIKVRRAAGDERIVWPTGGWTMPFSLRSDGTGGHGKSLDLGIIDEAFAHENHLVLQALRPTLIARPHAQIVLASAAGTDRSALLAYYRDLGRELVLNGTCRQARVAYIEYSADEVADDPTDPKVWRRVHPGIIDSAGRGLIRLEDLKAELQSMPLAEFSRSYLGIWATAETVKPPPPIDLAAWAAGLDPASGVPHGDPLSFGVDVSADRKWATITACGRRADGRLHVEVVANRQGTSWVPARLRELNASHHPVGVGYDPAGPVASLVPDLAGLPLVTAGGRTLAGACGAFADEVAERGIFHRGHGELNQAVERCQRRAFGETWVLSRRLSRADGGTDISPLLAAVVGVYAFVVAENTPVAALPDQWVF